jgi:hypothetical protein
MNESSFDDIFLLRRKILERRKILRLSKIISNALKNNSQNILFCFYQTSLVAICLDVFDEWKFFRMLIYIDLKIKRLLFHRIVHGEFRYQQVIAEIIYFIFHRSLKPLHDQKRNNGRGQSDGNASHCYLVNNRREIISSALPQSFRYKVRKVQRMIKFELTPAN